MNKIFFLIIIFIIGVNHSSGQSSFNYNKNDSALKYSPVTSRGYFNLLGNDLKEQVTAPFNMNKKQILNFGLFAVATTALIISDPAIDNFVRKLTKKNLCVRSASPIITNFGAKYGFYSVGVLELTGLVFKDKKLIISGLLATQAMITSGLFTRFGKIVFGRERPSASYRTKEIGGIWHGAPDFLDSWVDTKKIPGSGYDAFPSGHTSMAFSIATVYAMMYSNNVAVPVISYTIASLVGLSRLTEHAHWMSDVFVGTALGYLCGRQVVKNYQKLNAVEQSRHKHKDISLSLNYNEKTYFAAINYIF
jgi:membrane-associated phospholipid phosphatase